MALPTDASVRVRYAPWRRDAVEASPPPGHGLGLDLRFHGPEGGGVAQVGSCYEDSDDFILRSIRVRAPSEHTFLGRRTPIEVQLWHEPTVQRDLAVVREQRARAQARLTDLQEQVSSWGDVTQRLQRTATTNNSFPNLQTEEDWVRMARRSANRRGEDVLKEVVQLRDEMEAIDDRVASMIESMERPDSARMMVLSLLFVTSDTGGLQQAEASRFFRWLDAAGGGGGAAASAGGGGGPSAAPASPPAPPAALPADTVAAAAGAAGNATASGEEEFDFTLLPYQGSKDVGIGSAHRVFAYEGSLPRPPCTPIVRWFVASEPLGASSQALALLVNRTGGRCEAGLCSFGAASLDEGVWWGGGITAVPKAGVELPSQAIWSAVLSTDPFVKTQERLSMDSISILPWRYIRFYLAAFLVCAILMLCTACGMWARQCLDQ